MLTEQLNRSNVHQKEQAVICQPKKAPLFFVRAKLKAQRERVFHVQMWKIQFVSQEAFARFSNLHLEKQFGLDVKNRNCIPTYNTFWVIFTQSK